MVTTDQPGEPSASLLPEHWAKQTFAMKIQFPSSREKNVSHIFSRFLSMAEPQGKQLYLRIPTAKKQCAFMESSKCQLLVQGTLVTLSRLESKTVADLLHSVLRGFVSKRKLVYDCWQQGNMEPPQCGRITTFLLLNQTRCSLGFLDP